MKYLPIDSNLFIKNRKKFVAKMDANSLAIFNSNDIYPISADSTLPFAQHRDIFYLSGVNQEESILVLFPDSPKPEFREILFLKETNEHIAVWEGEKLTKEKAFETSGIKSVYWLQEFEKVFFELMTSVKEPEEIALIQQACNITEKGLRRVLKFVKPGVMEYEIEAEFAHEFLRNRADGFAYTPIIASGYNANVLHYIENNQPCNAGDVILMDVAAAYALYSSDMTRCIPVSGKFTQRQKDVYNAVLRVKKAAAKLLVPGTLWAEYHIEVGKLMTQELLGLDLLTQNDVTNENPSWPAYKKYFMHGTSHHMGLDTHDYGILTEPMKAGMVFTVEPGIYIPEENLGIRIEDNYVIQEQGEPINLMANIPIEADDIEALMNA